MDHAKTQDVTASSSASLKRYLARVRQDDDGSFVIHDLEEHLRAVAKLAGEFASIFGCSEWGHLAGLWHDLGKYSSVFQSCLLRENERTAWIWRVEE